MNQTRFQKCLQAALVLLLAGCSLRAAPAQPAPKPTVPVTLTAPPEATAALPPTETALSEVTAAPTQAIAEPPARRAFAEYALAPVSVQPSLQEEPIDPGMGNVLVPLLLSEEQLYRLGGDGLAASPRDYPEFHLLYQESVRNNIPVFVTSDSLLHAYHLIFDQLLSQLEETTFLPALRGLNTALIAQARSQYETLTDPAWKDAALRVWAYLMVGAKLADPGYSLTGPASELAEAELALIEAAAGPAPSPVFPRLKYGEDYSQYAPRGHYTKSEALKSYFKAMMWYGRMTFRLRDTEDPTAGPEETRAALLLSLAVRDGTAASRPALDLWRLLYDPTAFLIGRSDDLTIEDYLALIDTVYGPQAGLETVTVEERLGDFIAAGDALPAPRILGLLSDDYKPLEAVKGLRLLGQRFVVDAYIFQELIHPKVPQRFLPSGLDVMAVLGSERAATWLADDPTTQIEQYPAQFEKLQTWAADLSQDEWAETSYSAWIYALRPLLDAPGEGYPAFMRSAAWQDKQLNTALGSWSELKHDTLLYAKQPYGGIGGCGWPTPPPPLLAQNYVEPVPEVFARIAALAAMTRHGLEERELFARLQGDDAYAFTMSDRLESIEKKALDFKRMAEKELQGMPLDEAEQSNLRSFGDYLEEIFIWINGDDPEPAPAAIIADVATDPNKGEFLEAGIGSVDELYAVAPIPQPDGSLALTVARGAVFSYYEFPSTERLNDETWRAMLAEGQAPARPAFTEGFTASQPAPTEAQAVIYRFQRDWADWVYLTTGYNGSMGCPAAPEFRVHVSENVMRQAQAAVAELSAARRYEGRQWISTDYLSAEPSASDPQNLVVTVRETWSDFAVLYEGDDPFTWYEEGITEPITARRGPYTVDVQYELEPWDEPCQPGFRCSPPWRVVRFEELTARPAWTPPLP